MAQAIVSMKIMPISPDIDLDEMEIKVKEVVVKHVGEGEIRSEKVPVAFGLKSLNIIFVIDEKEHELDPIEADLTAIEGVNSVEVTDFRRALG
jgi:translation elongation factor aEF-1 beta